MRRRIWLAVMMAVMFLMAGCGEKETAESVNDTEAAEMEALDYDVKDYVKLGDYKKLSVQYPVPTVSDDDIEMSILDLTDENTEYNPVDRAITNGDYVSIDFDGTVNGEAFEGGSAQEYEFTLGDGEFLEDFENNLLGKSEGESVTFNLTFPEDYEEDLAGKTAEFTVKINSVYEVVVPEYNDEFVASVTDYDTTEAYEEFLREDLMLSAQEEAKMAAGEDALLLAVENATINGYPQALYDFCYNDTVESYQSYAEMFGMDFDEFMSEFMGDEDLEEVTLSWVNEILVSQAIAEKEGFEITDKNYEEEAEAMAVEYGYENLDDFTADYGKVSVIAELLRQKTIEFLYDNAEVEEVSEEEYYGENEKIEDTAEDEEISDTEVLM